MNHHRPHLHLPSSKIEVKRKPVCSLWKQKITLTKNVNSSISILCFYTSAIHFNGNMTTENYSIFIKFCKKVSTEVIRKKSLNNDNTSSHSLAEADVRALTPIWSKCLEGSEGPRLRTPRVLALRVILPRSHWHIFKFLCNSQLCLSCWLLLALRVTIGYHSVVFCHGLLSQARIS